MKKQHPIRTLLSLKQEEIAMLLGISRARWGMYEIGKRDLPLPAMQLLAEMLTYEKESNPIAKPTSDKQQQERQYQELECLLRKNEYQQLLLERKMAVTQKKQKAQLGLSSLVGFLNNRKAKDTDPKSMYFGNFARKAQQTPAADHATILMQQELKKEVLQFEKKCIEAKLREYDS
jgi:transcriptional regulator with XRE-family HTH domain